MGRQSVNKVIDGKEYTFYEFNATTAWTTWVSVSKMFGKPIGSAIDSIVKGSKGSINDLLDTSTSEMTKIVSIEKVVSQLMDNIDEDKTLKIVMKLMESTMFKGSRVNEIFDVHFQGEMLHLLKVISAALEVQFGDFLKGLFAKQGGKDTQHLK